MSRPVVTLDVRELLRTGSEPFSRIMETVSELKEEDFRLIAPFEPVPLYHVMRRLGFAPEARETSPGEWHVLFRRSSQREVATTESACGCAETPHELDARGLEPPEPMERILEAVANLPAGHQLKARTDRRPMHLYPQLEERGYTGITEEQPDGSFVTLIRSV